MSNSSPVTTANQHVAKKLAQVAQWPPLVYVLLGLVCSGICALGTSVQVLTSEAWIMRVSMRQIDFSAFGQLIDAISGRLPTSMLVPFIFGWGVQFALIVTSAGVELPPHPRWRYITAWVVSIGLVIINSCGDYASSSAYGFWGQLGFTCVILFITFVLGLLAIMCFMHAWQLLKVKPNNG